MATICVLPVWWMVCAANDPTLRLGWSTADVWFALLVMWGPWLLLAGAMLRWGNRPTSRGALVVGWTIVMILAGAMVTSGDGGGAPQGGINAGIYRLLLLCCQYASTCIATVAAWGLEWVGPSRARTDSGVIPTT